MKPKTALIILSLFLLIILFAGFLLFLNSKNIQPEPAVNKDADTETVAPIETEEVAKQKAMDEFLAEQEKKSNNRTEEEKQAINEATEEFLQTQEIKTINQTDEEKEAKQEAMDEFLLEQEERRKTSDAEKETKQKAMDEFLKNQQQ